MYERIGYNFADVCQFLDDVGQIKRRNATARYFSRATRKRSPMYANRFRFPACLSILLLAGFGITCGADGKQPSLVKSSNSHPRQLIADLRADLRPVDEQIRNAAFSTALENRTLHGVIPMTENQQDRTESRVKLLSLLLAVAAFFWGIYTYRANAQQQLAKEVAEALRTAETRRIEATRPFLDKQLELYTEATKVTAIIATSKERTEIEKARKRFEELYFGELALVERKDVAVAMIAFRQALLENKGQDELTGLALNLAHTCRDELAASWGTDAWKM